MKKLGAFILAIFVFTSFTSCKKTSAKDTVSQFLNAVKASDHTLAATHTTDTSFVLLSDYSEKDFIPQLEVISFISSFSFTLSEVLQENEHAVVLANITTNNFEDVMKYAVDSTLSEIANMEPTKIVTEELLNDLIQSKTKEAIVGGHYQTIDISIPVNLVFVDEVWQIEVDEQLKNALSGNIAVALAKYTDVE